MSWKCKLCETINSDSTNECEVCDAHAPFLSSFDYDVEETSDLALIRWKAVASKKVIVKYNDIEKDVTDKTTLQISLKEIKDISFFLSSDVAERTFVYNIDERAIIEFHADKTKLREGKEHTVELSWNIKHAKRATLRYGNQAESVTPKGHKQADCYSTTRFEIDALNRDGKSHVRKSIMVEVCKECEIVFIADKEYTLPGVPVKLTWDVKNAIGVTLNGNKVSSKDRKIVTPYVNTEYRLFVSDAFGETSQSIIVNMLPIPVVKSIFVPTPRIEKEITIENNIPRINVQVDVNTLGKEPNVNMSLPEFEKNEPEFEQLSFALFGKRKGLNFGKVLGTALTSIKNRIKELGSHGNK